MRPILLDFYHRYLHDKDCPAFIKDVSRHYMVGTIERLSESRDRMVRRAAVLAIGFLGDYESNPVLGRVLRDPDITVRAMAEHAIQQTWFRTGSDAQQKELLVLERLNLAQQYAKVIERASRLIDSSPTLAEAWNQRAIAYFNLMQFPESIKDCYATLERNPFHYPAAIGMGHSYLEINDTFNALHSFNRALRLNPGLNLVRTQVDFLKKNLNSE